MAAELVNMDRPANMHDHIGGLQDKVHFAPLSWFRTIATFVTPHAALGDLVKIEDDHGFLPAAADDYNVLTAYLAGEYMLFTDGIYYRCVTPTAAGEDPVTDAAKWADATSEMKGFVTLEGDFKSNTFEGETVGSWGSNNKKFTVKAKYHGTGPEAAEIEALLNNAEGILLTKRLVASGDPMVNQFGMEQMPSRCTGVKWASGTPESGEAGLELTFEAIQPRLIFYDGDILAKPIAE